MYRNISAEFPSIDEAEAVSRKIKHQIGNIERISIISKNETINKYNPYGHINQFDMSIGGRILPFNYGFYNSGVTPDLAQINNSIEDNFLNEIERKKSVILKINCRNDQLKAISSLLVSNGGLSIKKI